MINYENPTENNTTFINFLCDLDLPQSDCQKSQAPENQNEQKLPQITNTISTHSCEVSVLNTQLDKNILELEFTISKPSPVSTTSRKF